MVVEEEVKPDPDDEEAKIFGRYWMWKDYVGTQINEF